MGKKYEWQKCEKNSPESLSVTGANELVCCDWFGKALLIGSLIFFSGNINRGAIGRFFFDGFNALQNAHLNAEYSYSSCDTIPTHFM